MVETDENRLRQILINLLVERDQVHRQGPGHLPGELSQSGGRFEVEDTGIGIDAEDLDRIFRPFERARSARAKATGGTGLGLTITRLLTEIMGGEITVASTPDKGSTFRSSCCCPKSFNRAWRQSIGGRASSAIAARGRCVLVVDDDEIHRDLMRDLLEPLGFDIVTAGKRRRMPGAGQDAASRT